jgi:hypothetical protein
MSTRTDIMDLAGSPRAIEDLTGEELRALRALSDAGMIAPLDAAVSSPRPVRSQRESARGARPATQGALIAA